MSNLAFLSKKQFGSLDGLRALSIVGVVWHHAARGSALPLAEQGALGVPLFFAISGFLITTLLLRERVRTGEISLGAFYARRSLRIFPLYYTVLAVYVVMVALFEHDAAERGEFFANLPSFVTYTSSWFVPLENGGRVIFFFAWSLATEEQFYVVWPSIEKWLGGQRLHVHLPAVLALALVAVWTGVQTGVIALAHDSFARTVVVSLAPAICFGVVLAHALHSPGAFRIFEYAFGPKWTSLVLLIATCAAMIPATTASTIATFVLMALLVGACTIREDHGLAPLLRFAPIASIGRVSYGIYLMHLLVVNAVERVVAKAGFDPNAGATHVVVFAAALPAAWGVAWLSHRYYEARFLEIKGRFVR